MREQFKGYYRPTKAEFNELWRHARIIPDANVLLNFHRLSDTPRRSFTALFEELHERLWIPYQVALEYQHNRTNVKWAQRQIFQQLGNARDGFLASIEQIAASQQSHVVLDSSELLEKATGALDAFDEYLHAKQAEHDKQSGTDPFPDPVHETITSWFVNRVGPKPDGDGRLELLQEGRRRFDSRVPPGFEDRSKDPEDERYADWILWSQILDFAKETNGDVLFITDDKKADWWRIEHGRTLGPHPDLIQEFHDVTGREYYQYNSVRFLEEAIDRGFIARTTEAAIEEIRDLPSYSSSVSTQSIGGMMVLPQWDPTTIYYGSTGFQVIESKKYPTEIASGFIGRTYTEPDGSVRLELLAIGHQTSATLPGVSCVVWDPDNRTFTRNLDRMHSLRPVFPPLHWPGDFTSGDILTGGHTCRWYLLNDAGEEEFVLAGVEFQYPRL